MNHSVESKFALDFFFFSLLIHYNSRSKFHDLLSQKFPYSPSSTRKETKLTCFN